MTDGQQAALILFVGWAVVMALLVWWAVRSATKRAADHQQRDQTLADTPCPEDPTREQVEQYMQFVYDTLPEISAHNLRRVVCAQQKVIDALLAAKEKRNVTTSDL